MMAKKRIFCHCCNEFVGRSTYYYHKRRPRISKSQEAVIRGEDGEEDKEADGRNIEDVKGEGEDIAVPYRDNVPPLPYVPCGDDIIASISSQVIRARYTPNGSKLVDAIMNILATHLNPMLPPSVVLPASLKESLLYYDKHVPHSIVDVCPKECAIFDAAQINCSFSIRPDIMKRACHTCNSSILIYTPLARIIR